MKTKTAFARFAQAFFFFVHFAATFVLFKKSNDLFCSYVDHICF